MFKFVTDNGGNTPPKRQQVAKACDSCRQRKKRCVHGLDGVSARRTFPRGSTEKHASGARAAESAVCVLSSTQPSDATSPETPAQSGRDAGSGSVHPRPTAVSDNHDRDRDSTVTGRAEGQPQSQNVQSPESLGSRFIGDLSPEGVFLAATSPDANRGASMSDSVGVWLTNTLSKRAPQGTSTARTAAEPLSSSVFYGSTSLVQKVLVPVLEQECLAAVPPPHKFSALSKIYFEKIHPIFPAIDDDLYQSLPQMDPGRILLQQSICLAASKDFASKDHLIFADSEALLSCREFGDKVSRALRLEIEMGLVTDKIVLIQVLALMSQFIDGSDGGDMSSQLCARAVHHVHSIGLHVRGEREIQQDPYGATLLSCIWAIDRLNAAMNGRPVLMHHRDFSKDLDQCFQQQKPCFRLFIEVVKLLDKVIGLYRPSVASDPFVDEIYPSFEDLVVKCGGSGIATSSFATIESLYHAVTILSCRSKSCSDLQRSSIPYLRQSLSTSILSSTIGRELHDHLVLFPFIPYAASLSLSIAYREMRHGKISLHRARARAQFQIICGALSDLKEVYRSAATSADMGKKLLKEMDRVASNVAASGTKTPLEGAAAQNGARLGDLGDLSSALAPQTAQGDQTMTTNGEQTATQTWQEFDPSIFDAMADVDLFGMFDPSFNLDGFDACLESNLDPSFPTYFQ